MHDLLDSYSRMKLLEMARQDYDVEGLIARADKLANWAATGQKAADPNVGTGTMTITGYPDPSTLQNLPSMDKAAETNVLEFPTAEHPLVDDENQEPAQQRKQRVPKAKKAKAASGKKRGRPAKSNANGHDTGETQAEAHVETGSEPALASGPESAGEQQIAA